jgi:hypothetical protein
MAAGAGTDKENVAPSTSAAAKAAAAGPRRHGYSVRSCGVKKRLSRAARLQGRVPLRDITNLIAATSATIEVPEVPLGEDVSPAAAAELLAKSDAVAKKAPAAARYSLRKEFR